MKTNIALLSLVLTLTSLSHGHEAVTIGPNGGRVLYVDSSTTPNVEVIVNKEGRAEISLLDKDRKPIPLTTQTLSVTAGPRTEAKKLTTEAQGTKFLTDKDRIYITGSQASWVSAKTNTYLSTMSDVNSTYDRGLAAAERIRGSPGSARWSNGPIETVSERTCFQSPTSQRATGAK